MAAPTPSPGQVNKLADTLRSRISGEVRFDQILVPGFCLPSHGCVPKFAWIESQNLISGNRN